MTRITFVLFALFLVVFPVAAQTAEEQPWLDLQSVSFGLRYRALENHLGTHAQNWSDHHQGFKLRLKLDPAARYSLSAVALNGDTFTAGWNLRGLGDQSSNRVFVKQLFVTAKPRERMELQYGGLPIVRGESTEITSYDNDGYLMGQRLTLGDVTLTAGYLGDLRTPSVTRRFHRLSEVNYGQLLVRRRLTDRLTATADFTHDDGEHTLRQAMVIRPAKGVDLIRVEAYERLNGSRGAGGAITIEKPFGNTRLAATFASVDDRYRSVNADRYGRGRRVSFTSTTALSRDVSLQFFVT
ncbi:MAG TPA: hypothetical protein VEU30_00080, partial [Thermoanaerobaculia bacterium]|nr:hypothetical protein [Thermoanaerobaculia bacterium]